MRVRPETVFVFADNDSPAWTDAALTFARARYPSAHIGVRNPNFYRDNEHEPAEAIVIESRWTHICSQYPTATVLTEVDVRASSGTASVVVPLPRKRRA